MTFPRVKPGQRLNRNLPSSAVNGLFGLLEGKNRSATKVKGTGQVGDAIEILIKNKTGAPLAASFGIVEIGNVVFTQAASEATFYSEHIFEGNTPTAASTKIAIVQEPLSVDGIGKAIVQGVATVKLNVTDAADTHASPTTSTSQLTTGTSGIAQILWKEAGTGSGKWAKVLLHNIDPAVEYEGWSLQAWTTVSAADTPVEISGSWRRASDGSSVTYIELPSDGVWAVTAMITGIVACTPSGSGGAAHAVNLHGQLAASFGNGAEIIAPSDTAAGETGIIASAQAPNANGDYQDRGTLTLSGLFLATAAPRRLKLNVGIISEGATTGTVSATVDFTNGLFGGYSTGVLAHRLGG